MILINLSCLILFLPFACGTTPSVRQPDVGTLVNDTSNLQANAPWKSVSVPVPGQNPVNVLVQCNASLGAGLEARSCFNALSFAPRGDQQEIWLPENAPRGVPGNHLPILIFSGKLIMARPYHLVLGGTCAMYTRGTSGWTNHACKDDTSCSIAPVLVPRQRVGHASALNVSEAARAIIIGCIIPRRIGGWANNIGT